MNIKQAPTLLLSLLLCLPVLAFSAEKPADSAAATATKQLPTARKQETAKAKKAVKAQKTAKKPKPAAAQQKTAKAKTKSKKTAKYPKNGMSMKQVRKHYGQPKSTRKSKGKVKKQWPRITVWNYGKYSVYFERHTVLHTVVH